MGFGNGSLSTMIGGGVTDSSELLESHSDELEEDGHSLQSGSSVIWAYQFILRTD